MLQKKVTKIKGPKKRVIEMDFTGGDITSDSGVLALRQADKQLKLLEKVSKIISDPRDLSRCEHSLVSLLRQRVFSIALGYEDLNDHKTLRTDIAIQSACNCDEDLASPSTLCRLERYADKKAIFATNRIFVETFLDDLEKNPRDTIVLDFDATDDRVYGDQEGAYFNKYYDHNIFLPLHVFCGDKLLVSYLREGRFDGAKHAAAILKLLVYAIRRRFPNIQIIYRGDAGFYKALILDWCENNNVFYAVGYGKNSVIKSMVKPMEERAQNIYKETAENSRVVDSFFYQAGTWQGVRKVIVRAEHSENGANSRVIVTNVKGNSKEIYEEVYCGRGEMENRIKDLKLTLFSDRTSSSCWISNQFRVLLSSLAYVLLEHISRIGLEQPDSMYGEECEEKKINKLSLETIRLRLLKIGGVVIRNTRRVIIHMSSACPYQKLFFKMMTNLSTA